MVIVEQWDYSENHFEQFIGNFAIKSGADAKYLQKVLSEGGGKAFGLIVADEICKRLNALGDSDFKVPSWRLSSNERDLPSGWCERKSSAKADWLDSRAGIKGNERGFIQEFAEGEFWITVDFAYSPILVENVIKISSGYSTANSGKDTRFSTCVSNPDVGLYVAGSGELVTAHNTTRESFFRGNTLSQDRRNALVNAITKQLPLVLQDIGINFGVQLEFTVSKDQQFLLQVRPTPAIIYNYLGKAADPLPPYHMNYTESAILSPLVSGAFCHDNLDVVVYSGQNIGRCCNQTCLVIPTDVPMRRIFQIYQEINRTDCPCVISPYIIGANTKHYDSPEPECSDTTYPIRLNTQLSLSSIGLTGEKLTEVKKLTRVRIVSDGMVCAIRDLQTV